MSFPPRWWPAKWGHDLCFQTLGKRMITLIRLQHELLVTRNVCHCIQGINIRKSCIMWNRKSFFFLSKFSVEISSRLCSLGFTQGLDAETVSELHQHRQNGYCEIVTSIFLKAVRDTLTLGLSLTAAAYRVVCTLPWPPPTPCDYSPWPSKEKSDVEQKIYGTLHSNIFFPDQIFFPW